MSIHNFLRPAAPLAPGEAPERRVGQTINEDQYNAVVIKDGKEGISADEFRAIGGRLATLFDEAFPDAEARLNVDQTATYGEDAILSSMGLLPEDQGEAVDLDQLAAAPGLFGQLFEVSSSVSLILATRGDDLSFRNSIASMQWSRQYPRELVINAYDGTQYDIPSAQRKLHGLLARRMFFTPDSPPNRDLKVSLGNRAARDAQHISRRAARRMFSPWF